MSSDRYRHPYRGRGFPTRYMMILKCSKFKSVINKFSWKRIFIIREREGQAKRGVAIGTTVYSYMENRIPCNNHCLSINF